MHICSAMWGPDASSSVELSSFMCPSLIRPDPAAKRPPTNSGNIPIRGGFEEVPVGPQGRPNETPQKPVLRGPKGAAFTTWAACGALPTQITKIIRAWLLGIAAEAVAITSIFYQQGILRCACLRTDTPTSLQHFSKSVFGNMFFVIFAGLPPSSAIILLILLRSGQLWAKVDPIWSTVYQSWPRRTKCGRSRRAFRPRHPTGNRTHTECD